MAGLNELLEVNMISLVRKILRGKDLSKVTTRNVREEVISRLGDEATTDMSALKAAVKSALDIVLTDACNAQQERKSDDEEVHRNGKADNRYKKTGCDETMKAIDENQEENQEPEMETIEEPVPEIEEEDEIFVQRAKRNAKQSNQGSPKRPKKMTRTSHEDDCPFTKTTDFNRLKLVCRKLGCPVPPSRQKGSNMREKCANVLGFLRSKGVTERDPTRLRKEEISRHQKRIEREKDLEGLDVSNIIEEAGRGRRRRPLARPAKEETFPSDLSGPELSEKSDDEGEEYTVSDAESM